MRARLHLNIIPTPHSQFPIPHSPLLIDTDPGIDDAVAIALVAGLSGLEVVAITTVHGNTDTPRATRNAREIVKRVGLTVPVIAGAVTPLARSARPARETHGPEGLGFVEPSTQARPEPDRGAQTMITAAMNHERLALCCLGPLTNLARAVESEPTLAQRLGPVFIMGGTIDVPGTMTRWSEFNWWSDPEAADKVLRAGLDVRLVPLDVTRRIAVPGSAIRALASIGRDDEQARFWADALRFYAVFHRRHESFDGAIVNDALCVAVANDPTLCSWKPIRISVSLGDDERRGAVTVDGQEALPAQVALDVRATDVLGLIESVVFSRWLPHQSLLAGAIAADQWLMDNQLPEKSP
ncbi:MAG: nucleoside hydrolase [Gemmatimonadaceae bacterium]